MAFITQIAMLASGRLKEGLIEFIVIFPIWISSILALIACSINKPLLIWPFIIILVGWCALLRYPTVQVIFISRERNAPNCIFITTLELQISGKFAQKVKFGTSGNKKKTSNSDLENISKQIKDVKLGKSNFLKKSTEAQNIKEVQKYRIHCFISKS